MFRFKCRTCNFIFELDVSEQIKDSQLLTSKHNRSEIMKVIVSFILSNVDIHELRNLLHLEVNLIIGNKYCYLSFTSTVG